MRLRTVLATLPAGLAAATCLSAAGPASADSVANNACSPAASIDRFSDALDKTTYNGTFVGNFSALAVDSDGSPAALEDRSCLFGLDRKTLRPTSAVHLADEKGADLDSEGLVIDRDGTRLITSETEPSVRRYSRDGKILDRLPVPASLQVAPAGRATGNQTFEGLTLLPGGRTLLASMEYAISGDSAGIVRFQTWKRHHPRRAPPRPGARLHRGRRQHGPPLPRRPAARHGHQRCREPDRPGRRPADQEDPAGGHRRLPLPRRHRQAAPAEPPAGQHRGHDDHGT